MFRSYTAPRARWSLRTRERLARPRALEQNFHRCLSRGFFRFALRCFLSMTVDCDCKGGIAGVSLTDVRVDRVHRERDPAITGKALDDLGMGPARSAHTAYPVAHGRLG
jgi:hypothetical protein